MQKPYSANEFSCYRRGITSVTSADDSLDSPFRFTETPPTPCVICGDKAAVWVALFCCAHKAVCSPCNHQLHKNQSLQQCVVCQGRTRDWMAQLPKLTLAREWRSELSYSLTVLGFH
ncbi:hypothetical protein GOP47_0003895 [Adiantum capillus-veneris]|uniref:Uncharacterized protein n=1 Tax=Adiantum capillus-veneris TaxID=13818 RepID=A0A9D4V871_ADICA|nr:hypothetical protein GOP47_0003895 [Adiantum capillus-veneris]